MNRDQSSRPDILVPAFVALALFIVAWTLLHISWDEDYRSDQVLDTPVYQTYGNAMADGKVPYRDFAVEYPPGALPMFVLPGLAQHGHGQDVTSGFRHVFETLMWLCGAAVIFAMALVLRAVDATRRHVWGALTFAAVAPVAVGSMLLSRFDLWPTALVVASLAALAWERMRLGSGLLGAAITAKLFPAVLAPLVLTFVWRKRGAREALLCLGVLVAVVVLVFLPFVALAPKGVWHSLTGQLTRPLQIESLGAALLVAAHHAWGHPIKLETSHGSQNLVGHGAGALGVVSSVVQIAALVAIWIAFARSRGTREQLLGASAAAVVAFVALGKVLSPQFLIWLVPLVPLVRGRRAVWASAILGAALVATQVWFPVRYWDYANHFDPAMSWLVLARDVALVCLLGVLALRNRYSHELAARRATV